MSEIRWFIRKPLSLSGASGASRHARRRLPIAFQVHTVSGCMLDANFACTVMLPWCEVTVIQSSSAMPCRAPVPKSEEHTSELQSLMRISYAVFCLKKKKNNEE